MQVKFIYKGHRVKVKVTGATKRATATPRAYVTAWLQRSDGKSIAVIQGMILPTCWPGGTGTQHARRRMECAKLGPYGVRPHKSTWEHCKLVIVMDLGYVPLPICSDIILV